MPECPVFQSGDEWHPSKPPPSTYFAVVAMATKAERGRAERARQREHELDQARRAGKGENKV